MGICLSVIAALLSLTMHVHAAGPAEMKEVKKMDTALLIIDAQANMWESEYPLHNGAELLRKLETLVADARKAGILVVYIQNNGGPGDPDESGTKGWEIHPRVAPASGDIVIQKDKPSAFENTNLLQILRGKGIASLIIAGLQTEMCVKANCMGAIKSEYNVTLVEDAHSTFDGDSETAAQMILRHNKELGLLLTLKKMTDLSFVSP